MSNKTNTTQEILKSIENAKKPISSLEIQRIVPDIHRATVYRTLNTLRKTQVIRVVELGDGVVRFETTSDHHHHLVCYECKKVEKVELPIVEEKHLKKLEKTYENKLGFRSLEHSLEFFGVCKECHSIH